MDFALISDSELLEKVSSFVQCERRMTAEIIETIKEVDRRRLYLNLGFPSLFEYMTKHLGYSPGSAQRRIDSARMLRDVPELKEHLQSGELNLTQVSTLARAVRQKQKITTVTASEKKKILVAIQSLDISKTEKTIAQMLDVPIQTAERKSTQQDESVRVELTFSKEQFLLLGEVRSLMSHVNPAASITDIFEYLAQRFIKQKTGVQRSQARSAPNTTIPQGVTQIEETTSTARMAVDQASKKMDQHSHLKPRTRLSANSAANPRYIPLPIRKQLLQKQSCCQWKTNGRICGSQFQLQIDHIQPVWADGTSAPHNLQLLCGIHNRQKYRDETGLRIQLSAPL